MNYIMLNGTKINLTDEQVEEIKRTFSVNQIKLSDIAEGETFKVGNYEFVVLEHLEGKTAVILKDLLETNMKFGETNNFADEGCTVRKRLEEFASELEGLVGKDNLITHDIDLTADDGLKDYGTTTAKVSLLTCNLYRKYVEILDNYKVKKWWWLVTPFSTPKHDPDNWVKAVAPSGFVDYDCTYISYGGVRPFCIFNSNIFVSK